MTWLVTGGAGYIGSHVAHALADAGIGVRVLDDLSTGDESFVPGDAEFVRGTILDAQIVRRALQGVAGVIHLAGFKYAGVSVDRPLHTYQQNVTGTAVLLEQMQAADVSQIVFSSSAAVYGEPDVELVTEATPTVPTSPYGESKLVGEWLLRDQARAVPLAHTSLRYFNVVGSGMPHVYDRSPHNLFPRVFEALAEGRTPRINGDDYPTPDGTCVRDYVHVADVAAAHVHAAQRMTANEAIEPVYNLGGGDGISVAQIMTTMAQVTGHRFTAEVAPRRAGDPARIVASGELAARDLHWRMRHSLVDMVESAWRAHAARFAE